MPTYEYECDRCGTTFEVEQKITDPPITQCPHTMKEAVRGGYQKAPCDGTVKRLISKTNFTLKGGGWAKDGYRT